MKFLIQIFALIFATTLATAQQTNNVGDGDWFPVTTIIDGKTYLHNITKTNLAAALNLANSNALTASQSATLGAAVTNQGTAILKGVTFTNAGNALLSVASGSIDNYAGVQWGYNPNGYSENIYTVRVNGNYQYTLSHNSATIASFITGWNFPGDSMTAQEPTRFNAGGDSAYHPDGSIWQAMPVAPFAIVVSIYPNTQSTATSNSVQILTEITNQFINTGFTTNMAAGGTPILVWCDAPGILIRNPDSSLGWNTNFTVNITNNFIQPIHALGMTVSFGQYMDGDIFNTSPSTGTYVCTSTGSGLVFKSFASIGNANAYFQGTPVPIPMCAVTTPYELPADEKTFYNWGVDSASFNDEGMTVAGYHTFENTASYYSLFPTPANAPWTALYPNRPPLGLQFYETSYWISNSQNSLIDTAVSRNVVEQDQGAQPQFGTNSAMYSVSLLRMMESQYPLGEKTSHGLYTYFNDANDTLTHVCYVSSAIGSQIPRIFIPQANPANYASIFQFTNLTWASIHNDPLQAFPKLFNLGLNIGSVLVKPLYDGGKAVGVFDESPTTATNVVVAWQQLGFPTNAVVSVWDMNGPNASFLGMYRNSFSTNMAASTASLLRFNVAVNAGTTNLPVAGNALRFDGTNFYFGN